MINVTVPAEYRSIDPSAAHIYLLDYGDALLKPFSDKAHGYVAKVLTEQGVELQLGTGVKEVGTGHASLSDGTVIPTRCVIWGGGIMAAPVAADCGLAQGRGGRVDVQPDLTLRRHPRRVRGRRHRQHPGRGRRTAPAARLRRASERQVWAATTSWPTFEGKPRQRLPLQGQGHHGDDRPQAAIAEVGKHHHEVHGAARAHGLARRSRQPDDRNARQDRGVHRLGWDRFTKTGGPHVLDRGDAAEIDWDDDPAVSASAPPSKPQPTGTAA